MSKLTRRRFLKAAGIVAAAASQPALFAQTKGPSLPFAKKRKTVPANRKLRIAAIGAGGRGGACLKKLASEDIVALCDVDLARMADSVRAFPNAKLYRDYRQMLAEMSDQIDAVVVATPDHMHYPAAAMAMQYGKHVYVEKPLTHTIGEARALKKLAKETGLMTQMGNIGHANEGTRAVRELIESGEIGAVRKVVAWTNRPIWPQGVPFGEKQEVPETLDWNLWLGVSRHVDYNSMYVPFKWRGFWEWGTGAIGDMACHILDAPFWALNLRGDCVVSAQSEGCTGVSCPKGATVTIKFGKRGNLPPCELTWMEGTHAPEKPQELEGELSKGGVLYYGDKGILYCPSDYCSSYRLLPQSRWTEFKSRSQKNPIPKKYARVPNSDPFMEWVNACKGGPVPGSNFVDHAADLTVLGLLGNLAIRLNKTIDYDWDNAVCRNLPEADRLIHKFYRKF